MEQTVKFLKVRDVKSPNRANLYDAGIDFYVPRFNVNFIKDLKEKNPDIFTKVEQHCLCSVHISNGDVKAYEANRGTLTIAGNSSAKVNYDLDDINDSIIKFDEEKGENYFILAPHQRILIPSGIKSRMSNPGRALIAANKSGIASKFGLVVGASVVDYLYAGEIHINVINTSTKVVRIYENMKLVQFLETPVFNSEIEILNGCGNCPSGEDVVTSEDFYKGMSKERGEGGFGSSDTKTIKK